MRRRLRAVMAGLMVVAAGSATTAAFADGSGPVATSPGTPQTQTVSGVAVNGVALSVTAPAQLPLDLPGQQLPEREVDITVKDVGGQGYTGTVSTTLTADGAGATSATLRVDHYDLPSSSWQPQTVPVGQASVGVTDDVTVPANGTQVVKVRLSPGTAALDDVKVNVAANGATAVATMPVAGLSFQASGLTGSARAGASTVLTGKLTNSTDVDLTGIPVKLLLCSSGSAGCVAHASEVKVEVQTGGSWHTVSVSDATATTPMSATVLPALALPAASTAQFSVRVTIAAGAFGMSGSSGTPGSPGSPGSSGGSTTPGTPGSSATTGQPSGPPTSAAPPAQPLTVPLVLAPVGLTLTGQPNVSGTLTVQPPPQPTPTTPSSTPSTPATSATPTPTPSDPPTTADTPTDTPTATPTPGPLVTTEVASTPGATSSGNPTLLVAVGLLAVCLALVLWWGLMKRRERLARADGGAGDVPLAHDEVEPHGDGDGEQ
ncbi:hypothetical protein ABH920_002795 [Catenulispora sp. EB89]|uniref:hypothetical protein n=1 Tax=Catenulispora sp. EB89 TaxID=3156257 RepID=UPI003516AC62